MDVTHCCIFYQARHFKAMLKGANHLSKVQKVKVREKDTEAMLDEYNVSTGPAVCFY